MSLLPRPNADYHLKIPYRPGHCSCPQQTVLHTDKCVVWHCLVSANCLAIILKAPCIALLVHLCSDSIKLTHATACEAHMSVTAGWLQERLENLYKKDPGYSDKAASLFTLDLQSPQELPDNLRGEQWNFVQLPLSALQEELKQVEQVILITL